MITAYLMIGAFLGGWLAGATSWEIAGASLLCLAWPYLAFVLFKMWREGKL